MTTMTAYASLARIVPPARKLGLVRFLRAQARNPMESWPREIYEERLLIAGTAGRRAIMLTDPDDIQQVLVSEADAFERTQEMLRALSPSLGEGLLTADGAHWRWQRRVAAPAFRHERVNGFVPAMSRAADDTAQRWDALVTAAGANEAAGSGGESGFGGASDFGGAAIDLGHEMMRTTFDIIVDTMLSGELAIDVARVERSISTALESSNWSMLYASIGLPKWMPYPRMREVKKARAFMRGMALDVVTARRQAHAAGGARRGDLVDMLLDAEDPDASGEEGGGRMADREIADNILTFIAAGHETTALALTWGLYALSHHPEVTAKILAEIATVMGADDAPIDASNVGDLVYTRQVVQEVMRLYPSAPVIARLANRSVTIGTTEIRAGDTIVLPIYVVHRHARLWEDPDRFDPERFAPAAVARRHRYAFLPFGAGPRVCIGMGFAITEAVIILAALLPRFRIEAEPGLAPELTMKITLRPKSSIRMRVHRRD